MTFSSPALTALPAEVVLEILLHLPTTSLLTFSQTSQTAHSLALSALQSLHLGVYHTRIGSVISSISRSTASLTTSGTSFAGRGASQHIPIILSKREARDKNQIISNQTERLVEIVSRYTSTLRDLEVSAWALEDSLADLIASIKNLRCLSIRLDHPHVRHPRVPKSFWDLSPPSTVWNLLSSGGGILSPSWSGKARRCSGQALGRLEAITLERAGITDFQLLRLLERNPGIKEIRLQKCLTLTAGFFEGLAELDLSRRIEVLAFTKNDSADIDDRILEHIGELTSLKALSLHAVSNLDNDTVKKWNDNVWRIPDLTLPHSPDSPTGYKDIEVDPEYK
ncbi:MAG: hypothetical protein M1814_006387 [Vezdaea aestivalis]|nr:MAG: hypothetical protein M1814_006387 [Vezdaea aestivalis]